MTLPKGLIAGYDPGGNGGHGLAMASIIEGRCIRLVTRTLDDAEAIISVLEQAEDLYAIGVDTLAAWATGPSGWRAADLWLRSRYPQVRASVVSPNGLYGSMALNGMSVLNSICRPSTKVQITETHPKVLYWALTGTKYNYQERSQLMDSQLSEWLGCQVKTKNDHEWDAAVSVYATICGLDGSWTHDLLTETAGSNGRLVFPQGKTTCYWWPE